MENQINSYNEFTNSKGAMSILLIKSKTTLAKYEREMMFKVYRIGNRKRYKVSELLKFITKGSNRCLFLLNYSASRNFTVIFTVQAKNPC